MTGVTKSYNINYYWIASSPNTTTSNSANVTLLSLRSGSNYTVTVVTVGVRGYQSTPVSGSMFTKPLSVKSPQFYYVTTISVSLNWSKPDEYQSSYSYRVQTNVNSSSTLINNMIVTNESATIVNLTPGETYTFLVYTRAADNVTESDPVSLTTCTVPGQAVGVTVNNYKSVNSLVVNWTAPAGKVSYYNVTITGDVNNTIQSNITQANFTGLSPGRNYTVTVQTVSGSCSSAIITVTEATYPSPPGNITFITIGTNTTTLSWGEPVNMTGVTKSYNINYYWNASSPNTTTSNSANVTLLSLKSGSNYTIAVVTVGVRGYQSTPVSGSMFTKPLPVKSPQFYYVTTTSVSLNWSKPDEYQSSYSYRVQTNVTSSSTLINNTIVTNESATIVSLTPGETYTFLVYTRAADNVTESDPVSLTTCTVPGQAVGVTVNNYKSVNSLVVNWTAPAGKVSYYNVTITGDVNNTIQTNTTQANFTGLSPGRNYTVTVQTVSGSCSNAIITMTEATYPSPPGNITFITIGTNTTTLSWGEPVNMIGVTKSYNINYYWDASSPNTTTSNSANVTLLSLKSGSNYTVTMVTVGVRGYQSTPVSGSVFTKPLSVKSPQFYYVTTTSVSLNWSKPDEYQSSYSYRVQTNVTLSSTLINNTIVTNESATIVSLTPGETYTFLVYTRAADNVTESDLVSLTTCTVPGQAVGVTVNNFKSVNSLVVNWTAPAGKVSYYNVTITGDVNNTIQTNITQANFTGLSPGRNYTVTVQTVSGSCSSAIITVTEATYPTPPGNITFITTGTNTTTLSWGEPVNMIGVTKSYYINYYWNASSPNTTTSNSTNVTLLSLKSGRNYTVTVVTVGVRGYQSTPVSRFVFTKPFSVKSPQSYNVTTTSVFLNWNKPDEYQSSYSYRVQTNVTTSSTLINNMIVTNESATIVSLTPGETYTFLVYTRAADNVTESDPVSLTTCTVPGQAVGVTVNNYKSVNSLVVNWTAPAGKVSYYNVTITGDVNNTIQSNTTQVNFTYLLPGRNYTVTVQTVSENCSSAIITVTEATYPSPPGNITFIAIGTNITTLSWGEPINMTGVTKSYSITYYWKASSSNTTTSISPNVTLLSLKSGSNYTVTVVTVGVRGYQSTPVSGSVFTKPLSVKSPQSYNVATTSVSLNWSKPDEYQSFYSYRVQTNVTSPSTLINNTIVTNESTTIVSLTPGETYTFLVYTRASDNVTESDPVSLTTCTVPEQAVGVTVNNYNFVNFLAVNWMAPAGKASYYNVIITGDVNNTTQTNTTQANFTGLSPGRNYTVIVQTVSGSCSSAITTVTEATYPSPPGNITFITTGTNTTTLSWGEPVKMTGVTKSYNITYYWNIYSPNTMTSSSTNVTLVSLKSGSNYTVTVVTVGVRGYQSTPVSGFVFTKPLPVKSPQSYNVITTSVSLNWSKPNEYQSSYSYRVQTNVTSSSTLINNTIVTNESATIVSLMPGETYTFLVYTRAADNVTESDPVSLTTCTAPGQAVGVTVNNYKSVNSLAVNWTAPAGKASYYNVTITGDVNRTIQTYTTQANFTGLSPGRNYTVTVQTVSGNCSSAITTVTEATYPNPPGSIAFNTISANTITLSWVEPTNMTGLVPSYNITYWNASSSSNWTQISNTNSVTLQSLTSGTNYTISVVTVGVRGYQSMPVTASVYTKPWPVLNLQFLIVMANSAILNWEKPSEYQSAYSYRVQTNVTSSSTLINNMIVTNESATIVSLTAGETYTFLVYTRAADNVTESDPVNKTICTGPGFVSITALNNNHSINTLGVIWTTSSGKVDYYVVYITGDVKNTAKTNSTQTYFTGLLPGREYTVTVQTVSGNCSQTSSSATEATYPTPPGSITFTMIGTKNFTLSWGDPVNMTGVVKSYYITYWISSSPSIVAGNVTSNQTTVTLQNQISGSNYTMSVVTVGVRGYQSTPVTALVCTKPISVKLPMIASKSTHSMTLNWSQPDEYQSSYSYRVQTNINSSSTMINNTIVINGAAAIFNLMPGETYTFLIYTRSACNSTESDPVSITDCTLPGQAVNAISDSYKSVNSLAVNWTAPAGKTSYYNVTITGDVTNTIQTNTTQVNFTGLSPGREYNLTILTVSSSCSQAAPVLTQATYPTPPSYLAITATETHSVTISWGNPVNMFGAAKYYSISYWIPPLPSTVTTYKEVGTSSTITNLASGTNYAISVVTVGVRGYQSTPVSSSVFTIPEQASAITVTNSRNSLAVNWMAPAGKVSYYTAVITGDVNDVQQTNSPSVTFSGLLPDRNYTITIHTVSGDCTNTTPPIIAHTFGVGYPSSVAADSYGSTDQLVVTWTAAAGDVDYYVVAISGDVSYATLTKSTTEYLTGLLPGSEYTVTVTAVSGLYDATASAVTAATYPSPPEYITFTTVGTNNIALSWGDPVNMTWVVKSYYITYRNSSSVTWTYTSIASDIVLGGLTSGTVYTFTVVTEGVRGYQSTPVTASVSTRPFFVAQAQISDVTSDTVYLSWSKPDEYQSSYSYRVQTNVTSPSTLINNMIVTNESVTIVSLTPGETYTFLVYTRAADNVTESDPVSLTTCTVPEEVTSITVSNDKSVSSLVVKWTAPAGKVSYYTITITGDVYNTTDTSDTQLTFIGLLPGREYNITVQTVSGNCTNISPPVTEATYASPPGDITFITVSPDIVILFWEEPVTMTGVTKSYNITYYWDVSFPLSVTSNSPNVTLQSLKSGTNYTVTVVTVGIREYQSTPVSRFVYTIPEEATSITLRNNQLVNSLMVNWMAPAGKVSYYTVTITGDVYNTTDTSDTQVTFNGLLPGREYNITIQTVSGNCTNTSIPVTEATYASPPGDITFITVSPDIMILFWGQPLNMTGVTKSYNITYYCNVSFPISVTSNSPNVTLRSLKSGTNYTVIVVTVGIWEYQSTPVSRFVYTKPRPVVNPHVMDVTSTSVSLSWSKPEEYQSSYSYRVQTNVTSPSTLINNTIVTNESATIVSLTPGETYTFLVYTRAADNVTESDPVSLTTCTKPRPVVNPHVMDVTSTSVSLSWSKPEEYQSSYSYRVQTNVTSPSTLINNTIVINESATIVSLTPGETYTFLVYTRAADNVTESDPVSLTTCTKPAPVKYLWKAAFSADSVFLAWNRPDEYQSSYIYRVQTNATSPSTLINNTIVTNESATIVSLTPGETYTFLVYTRAADNVTESDPVSLTTCTVPGQAYAISIHNSQSSNVLGVTWTAPAGKVDYYKVSLTGALTDNQQTNSTQETFMGLLPGREYTVTVQTVSGTCNKTSPPVTEATCPTETPGSVRVVRSLSGDAMNVTFQSFDNSNGPTVAYAIILTTDLNGNKPTKGSLAMTYNDFKNGLTRTYVTSVIEQRHTRRTARSNEISAPVGDGTASRGYVNGPLDPALQVSIAGFTAINYDPATDTINGDQSTATVTGFSDSASTTTTTTSTATSFDGIQTINVGSADAGAIAGGVVGGIVGFSALGALGFFFWRKKRKNTGEVQTGLSRRQPVKIENFQAAYDKLKANDNEGLILEFDSLQSVGVLQSRSVAMHPTNAVKNHHDAVVPYDMSRVKVSTLEDSADGYINASYIPGNRSPKEFIAAQSPLPNTVRDFWYMIWEKRINTIVMFSECQDNGRVRNEEYWPSREAKVFGDKVVTFISDDILRNRTIRKFMMTNVKSNENRQVRQFHYTSWSNNWNFNEREVFREFVNLVQQNRMENSGNSPTLVHCSSGAGRTGVFIALNCIMNQLEENSAVDVYGIVHHMNLHRPLMIQTEDQYMLLYQCALDVIRGQEEGKSGDNYDNYDTVIEEPLYVKISNIPRSRPTQKDKEDIYEQTLNTDWGLS
ncbi:uncharacterized protein ACMZJ9_016859 [Mantella aurantiaca]